MKLSECWSDMLKLSSTGNDAGSMILGSLHAIDHLLHGTKKDGVAIIQIRRCQCIHKLFCIWLRKKFPDLANRIKIVIDGFANFVYVVLEA